MGPLRVVGLIAALLAGCDLVFPIQATPGGPTERVTVRVKLRRIQSAISGQVRSPPVEFDINATDVFVRFEDGREEVVVFADGGYSFDHAPGERYALRFVSDGSVEIQHTAPEVTFTFESAGRLATPSPAQTVTLAPSGPANLIPHVASTGQWTYTPIAASGMIDWTPDTITATGGLRAGRISASEGDILFYLIRDTDDDIARITAVGKYADIEMTGAPIDLTAEGPTPVATDACVNVISETSLQAAEFAAALPEFGPPAVGWQIDAIPDRDLGPTVGLLQLASATHTLATDLDTFADIHNPFDDHDLVVGVSLTGLRFVTLPMSSATPARLVALQAFHTTAENVLACASNVAKLESSATVPFDITVDGTLLDADFRTVSAGDTDTVVTWKQRGPGTPDYFDVILLEAVEADGATELRPERTYRTVDPQIRIRAGDLTSGFHGLVITAHSGFAGAADGDFATLSYPTTATVVFSPIFAVQ